MNPSKLRKICADATKGKWLKFGTTIQKENRTWICDCHHDEALDNANYIATFSPERVGLMLDVIESASDCCASIDHIEQIKLSIELSKALDKLNDYESGEK